MAHKQEDPFIIEPRVTIELSQLLIDHDLKSRCLVSKALYDITT